MPSHITVCIDFGDFDEFGELNVRIVLNTLIWKFLKIFFAPHLFSFVTFRVSRRPREMYCGHTRLCVCLCVCPRPHAHTIARTRMLLGGVVGDAP